MFFMNNYVALILIVYAFVLARIIRTIIPPISVKEYWDCRSQGKSDCLQIREYKAAGLR